MTDLKRSPLCSRDDGREIYFTVRRDAAKFRMTVPREMLDDEIGNAAGEKDRKIWVTANIANILEQLTNSNSGAPFDRIRVEEIT